MASISKEDWKRLFQLCLAILVVTIVGGFIYSIATPSEDARPYSISQTPDVVPTDEEGGGIGLLGIVLLVGGAICLFLPLMWMLWDD